MCVPTSQHLCPSPPRSGRDLTVDNFSHPDNYPLITSKLSPNFNRPINSSQGFVNSLVSESFVA